MRCEQPKFVNISVTALKPAWILTTTEICERCRHWVSNFTQTPYLVYYYCISYKTKQTFTMFTNGYNSTTTMD